MHPFPSCEISRVATGVQGVSVTRITHGGSHVCYGDVAACPNEGILSREVSFPDVVRFMSTVDYFIIRSASSAVTVVSKKYITGVEFQ